MRRLRETRKKITTSVTPPQPIDVQSESSLPEQTTTPTDKEQTNGRPKNRKSFAKWDDSPLSKEERKHPLAECENCPLGRVGKFVPSRFPVSEQGGSGRSLAFIGEAPAKNEIRQGEPFVGMSGQLLNTVLDNYKLNRDEVFLTNACLCHYPDTMKELPADAIAACRPRLEQELQDAGVDTVVLMGNSAVKSVLPPAVARKGITKLRQGPPKRFPELDFDVVPTFHPAACLRSQQNFPFMVDDVGKAIAQTKPTLWYEPTIHVVDEAWEALPVIDELAHESFYRDYAPIIDTESGFDKDVTYGRSDGAFGRILCVGLGLDGGQYKDDVWVLSDRAMRPHPIFGTRVKDAMRKWFSSSGVIMQNGKYDIGVLMNFLDSPTPFKLRFDTMLASYSLNETGGIHGLKYQGVEILGTPDWDSVIKPFITKEQGFGSIPRPLLYKYNAFDVHVTRLMKQYFQPLLEQQGLTKLHDFLCEISYMLTEVERRGLGFDLEISKEIEERLNAEIDEIDAKMPENPIPALKKDGTPKNPGELMNPRSVKQIKEYFYANQVKGYGNRDDKGDVIGSTEEDTLKLLLDRSDNAVPAAVKGTISTILASRKVSKLRGTYVTGLQEKRTAAGTIHPSFLIHGTNTGRLSSRGPNSQNIPRSGDIKKQFVPSDPSRKMVQVDYSQAELRVLTWLAKEPLFRDIFNDPTRDIFDDLCDGMFPGFKAQKYTRDVTGMLPAEKEKYENQDTAIKAWAKEMRTLVKTFAYGISYGRTAEGIAADPAFNMSVHEADSHMKNFQRQIPQIMRYQQEEVIDRIHAGKDLINPYGRHKRFWLITDMNKKNVHNEACAFMPQSTASDMCLTAAIQANKEGIHIVNLIHDAILFEAPPDEADDQARRVNDLMVASAAEITGGYVDFATDYSVGNSWYEVR